MRYRTISANRQMIQPAWHIIDAEGEILGRLASKVAVIIRGKNKPIFTPNTNCGDKVVIINVEKVRMTGKKMTDKKYISHTGYPGGQKVKTPVQILEKYPEQLIYRAVKNMLPPNRLRQEYLKNMHLYIGTEHPHSAQKPVKLEL